MWLFQEQQINQLEDFGDITPFGFIYITTHIPTGMKYLGKKSLFHNTNKKLGKKEIAALPVTPGRKPTTKLVTKESDWLSYYGSADSIKKLIKEKKQSELNREIIHLIFNKKLLSYYENKYLFSYGVLENPDVWLNDNIQGRFFTKDFL
jgi:hypothetical protein